MFQREKKAGFPFILFGLFDPEGLGLGAGLTKKRKRPFSAVQIYGISHEIKETRRTQ
ncbi:hypothetical protein ACQCVP_08870 [Rossellomorea vietnamensis]|uniref:hypothetical protein n=1 Tax=Rossellomorea vietnamensis TaxID=218284 RepID=UPI003CE83797